MYVYKVDKYLCILQETYLFYMQMQTHQIWPYMQLILIVHEFHICELPVG